MSHLGQNASGDFDQLSLHGVDFGADYMEEFEGTINNMEGVSMYSEQLGYDAGQLGSYSQQMGSGADFGLIPSGLGKNPDFGLIPSGMGYYPSQMGSFMTTLKTPVFTLGGFQVNYMHIGILAALGLGYYAHRQGMIRIPGL